MNYARMVSRFIAPATVLVACCATLTAHANPCDWNNPGVNPYRGSVSDAVDNYQQIPTPIREKLKARMEKHAYTDYVLIKRDSIEGKNQYEPELRSMHFGAGSICGTVDRSKWDASYQAPALVYCEAEFCVAVPIICRNVSLITPRKVVAAASGGSGRLGNPPGYIPVIPAIVLPTVVPVPEPLPKTFAGLSTPPQPWAGWPAFVIVGGGGYYRPPPVIPVPPPAVPEPSSWMLLLVGLVGLSATLHRRRRQ